MGSEKSRKNLLFEKDFTISYWRTKNGIEVDFILGDGQSAIEIKGGKNIDVSALRPLKLFSEYYKLKRSIVVSNEANPRLIDNIEILP